MIKFTSFRKKEQQNISEMSITDAKKFLSNAIDGADDKQVAAMIKALEKPALEKKLRELFVKKKLQSYIKDEGQTLLNKVMKIKAEPNERLEFFDNLMNGKYITPSKFINATSGNIKDSMNFSDHLISTLFPWMLQWTPKIDGNVAVGPAEAIFIFCAADGAKGGDAGGGDVAMGGKLIEVKVDGGSMGKDGPKYWGGTQDWFYDNAVKMAPGLAGMDKKELLALAPTKGSHVNRSKGVNKLSMAMRVAGKSDTDIEAFWKAWVKEALGKKLNVKIGVSKGVVQYDDLVRYMIGAAYEKYKDQTNFDMVTLITKDKGDFINFTKGEDFFNNKAWGYDSSFTWSGGGHGTGVNLTPRITLGGGQQPTVRSDMDEKLLKNQFNAIKAVANAVDKKQKSKVEQLMKSIKISPRLQHYMLITKSTNAKVKDAALATKTKKDLESWVKANLK